MTDVDTTSLRGRLAARRQELRTEKPIDLDVPGYKDILKVRYRALDYPTIRSIGLKQRANTNQADSELKIATDTLTTACECLLEVLPDGSVRETQFRWDWTTARELFGVGEDEMPDNATPRVALSRIIPSTTTLMLHYAEYDQSVRGVEQEVQEEVEGE